MNRGPKILFLEVHKTVDGIMENDCNGFFPLENNLYALIKLGKQLSYSLPK